MPCGWPPGEGHRKSPVHLYLSGCHTGKTLEEKRRQRKRHRIETEGEGGEKEKSASYRASQVTEQ